MRKVISLLAAVTILCLTNYTAKAQMSYGGEPYSFSHTISQVVPTIDIEALAAEKLLAEDAANPGKTVFLQDTVKVPDVCKLMAAEAKKQGAKYTLNVVSAPATNPWFFGFKEVHVSANIIK